MAERSGETTRKFEDWRRGGAAVARTRTALEAGAEGAAGLRRGRRGRGRVEGLDRAGVQDDRAGDPAAGQRRVVEPLLDRRRRLGVVGEHDVLPRGVAAHGAERALQAREQVGVVGLAAAARAEDRADEGRHGEDVVDRGRRLARVAHLRQVGVDAVGVGLGVGDDLPALGAVGPDEEVLLLRHERLGRRARRERLAARDERERVDAGHVRDGDPGRAAPELDEQPAVAGRAPAGAEGDVRAGLAVDVRDPVAVVDQAQAGTARLLLVGRADRGEVLGEVELLDVVLRDVVAQRRQPGVGQELVGRVHGGREPAEVARAAGCSGRCHRRRRARRAPRRAGRRRRAGTRRDDARDRSSSWNDAARPRAAPRHSRTPGAP